MLTDIYTTLFTWKYLPNFSLYSSKQFCYADFLKVLLKFNEGRKHFPTVPAQHTQWFTHVVCENGSTVFSENQDVIFTFSWGRHFYAVHCRSTRICYHSNAAWLTARMIRKRRRLGCNQYNIEHFDVRSVSARSVWSVLTIDFLALGIISRASLVCILNSAYYTSPTLHLCYHRLNTFLALFDTVEKSSC